MNKKYKVMVSSTALGALLTTGVLATAISCGTDANGEDSKQADKYANRIHFFKFNGKKYNTFKQAENAQKQFIDGEIKKELNSSSNKVDAYKYKGKEYLTKEELFDVYKNDVKIQKVYFDNTDATFNDVKKTHALKDVEDKQIKAGSNVFAFNKKGYKNIDDAIKEYFKGANGDKSGKTYLEKFYDKNTQAFGKTGAILGINKARLGGVGAEDGKFYVTKNNTKAALASQTTHQSIIDQITGFKLAQYTPKTTITDHSNDVAIYKKEFLKVIHDMKYYRENEGYEDNITNTLMAANNIPTITLPSGQSYTNTKLFLAVATFNNKNYSATTIKQMVDAATTTEDLNYLWKLMKTRTWGYKTDNGGGWLGTYHDDDNISFREIVDHWSFNDDSRGRFKRYVNNDAFNFERKFEVNGKWFNSKEEAKRTIEKLSSAQPITKVDNTFSEIKVADLTIKADLKTILITKLGKTLNRDFGSKDNRARGFYIDSSGLAATNPLKAIEVNSKIPAFDLLRLIKTTQTISELKVMFDFLKDKTIEAQDITRKTPLELDTFKVIYNGKAFTTKDEALKAFALENHLKGVFLPGGVDFVAFENVKTATGRDKAIKDSKAAIAADNTLDLFDYETGAPAATNAVAGENNQATPGTGDESGNVYEKVKATSKNELGGVNSIIGKNFTADEIKAELQKVDAWKNPATPSNIIKKMTLEEGVKASLKNIVEGRIVILKTNTINKEGDIHFDSSIDDETLIESSQALKKVKSKEFIRSKNGVVLNKEEFKKQLTSNFLSTKFSQIDEMNISKKQPNIFDGVDLSPIAISGSNGTGSIKDTISENDFDGDLLLNFKVKRSNGKSEDITGSLETAALQNGDVIIVTIQKSKSFITRTIKVTGLKLGLIDFFKSSDPKIEASRKIVFDKLKEDLKALLPELEKSFVELGDAFKEYMGAKVAARTVAKKRKLVKAIFAAKDTIDKQVFEKIASRKDSILNILVEELYKNNIYLDSISHDGAKIKEDIKNEINDLLDIFKVIIDHTFEFLGNSIFWEKEWNKTANFVAKTSTLDSTIAKLTAAAPAKGSSEASDLNFLKKLKSNGNFFASKKEQENSIFKTASELMKDNSNEYKIYKETAKDKAGNDIPGEFIYHIIKDVNARKITNVFRKNFNYTKFDKHGTLDNLGLVKGKTADNFVKGILDRAQARQKNNWKNLDPKDISLKELYKKQAAAGSGSSSSSSLGGINISSFLPMIKNILGGGSISSTLKSVAGLAGGALGINGIANIPEIFKALSGSGSDVLIGVENNISGLLTYLVGDKANVVIDITSKADGTFELKDYYSPQIRVIDKANNDKIIYRKDNLDQFFNRLKPFMDLVYEFLGSMGK